MKYIDIIARILVIVGSVNWGLVALFNFNLVTVIFSAAVLVKIVYCCVAASGIWLAKDILK